MSKEIAEKSDDIVLNGNPPTKRSSGLDEELEERLDKLERHPSKRPCNDVARRFDLITVNRRLSLESLNIKKGDIIVLRRDQGGYAQLLALQCAIGSTWSYPLDIVERKMDDKYVYTVYINNIRIADGISANDKESRGTACNRTMDYLVERGMRVLSPNDFTEENKYIVDMQSILQKSGAREKVIEELIEEELVKFLVDPKLIELETSWNPLKESDDTDRMLRKFLFRIGGRSYLSCRIPYTHKGSSKTSFYMRKKSTMKHFISDDLVPEKSAKEELLDVDDDDDDDYEDRNILPSKSLIEILDKEYGYKTLNQGVALKDLGLTDFQGIVGQEFVTEPEELVQSICEACDVKYKCVKTKMDPNTLTMAESLYINDVFIVDEHKKLTSQDKEAGAINAVHRECLKAGLKVLIYKGLVLITQNEVSQERVQHISKGDLTVKGDDLRVFEETLEELFDGFLKDPAMLKLIISNQLDKYERQVVKDNATKHKLGFNLEGTAHIAVWKVNSKIHSMDSFSAHVKPELEEAFITAEDLLTAGTDLRRVTDCIEKEIMNFYENTSLQKLNFPSDLGDYEKGIVERTAGKWELHFIVDEETGVPTVSKSAKEDSKIYHNHKIKQRVMKKANRRIKRLVEKQKKIPPTTSRSSIKHNPPSRRKLMNHSRNATPRHEDRINPPIQHRPMNHSRNSTHRYDDRISPPIQHKIMNHSRMPHNENRSSGLLPRPPVGHHGGTESQPSLVSGNQGSSWTHAVDPSRQQRH